MNILRINAKYILFIIFIGALTGCNDKEKPNITLQDVVEFKQEGILYLKKRSSDSIIKRLVIEIANDEYEIQTGLMFRNEMNETEAMLFVFPNEDYRSFYMKNTRFPLDIIYIDAKMEIVSIIKHASPFDETPLSSLAPAKYVLEINAGLTDMWNVENGDSIEFVLSH